MGDISKWSTLDRWCGFGLESRCGARGDERLAAVTLSLGPVLIIDLTVKCNQERRNGMLRRLSIIILKYMDGVFDNKLRDPRRREFNSHCVLLFHSARAKGNRRAHLLEQVETYGRTGVDVLGCSCVSV